jgi:molecular chaperone DnaK (HSP70)
MGTGRVTRLGDRDYSPQEISALILKRLKSAAEAAVGEPIVKAVITVPAYFSDAARNATREAGLLAGFQVERIIHEPTAAALCYENENGASHKHLVYDLGGGTFDVSLVRTSSDVTEVLASHGDTALGGDDFDALLVGYLARRFEEHHGFDPRGEIVAASRLASAAENCKIALSREPYSRVRLESLATRDGVALNLDVEVSRENYEGMIETLVDKTRDSVQRTLTDTAHLARDLDDVLLVGGSCRTPLVWRMLERALGITPRMEVNPDQAVALGATIHAARLAGDESKRILVDVTPYTFGTACFGPLNGLLSTNCFVPLIRRNSPLPARHTEVFFTMVDGQKATDMRIYQGEEEDASNNRLIGRFMVEGLDEDAAAGSAVLCDMALDLDGILHVEVTEKHTGLRKKVTVTDAFSCLDEGQLSAAQRTLCAAMGESDPLPTPENAVSLPDDATDEERASWDKALTLIATAHGKMNELDAQDREELAALSAGLNSALSAMDFPTIDRVGRELQDVLFYVS